MDGSGIEFREAHFPGRAPIDAYGNGGFRFAGMSHRGSLICLPSAIYAWDVSGPEDFNIDNLARVFEESDEIEVFLMGTGVELIPVKPKLRNLLRENAISGDSMATGAAVRTYNVLVSEGRAVAAALLAVD